MGHATYVYRSRINDLTTALGRRQQAEVLAGRESEGWSTFVSDLSRPKSWAIWYYNPTRCPSCDLDAARQGWSQLDSRWPGVSATVVVDADGALDIVQSGGYEPLGHELIRAVVTAVWNQVLQDALVWSIKIVISDDGAILHAEGALPVECYWSLEDKLLRGMFGIGSVGE